MKAVRFLAVAAIAVLTFTGCSKSSKQQTIEFDSNLQNIVWQLVKFDGEDFNRADRYEITFHESGRVFGIGECNRFFGAYTLLNRGGGIKFGPLGSTRMACPGDDIETEFFGMLESVTQYQFSGNYLYLFSGDSRAARAVFVATDKPIPAE